MFLVTVRAQIPPEKTKEFARRWKNFYQGRLRDMPGFEVAYYAAEQRATDASLAVLIFSSKPNEAQLQTNMQAFSGVVGDLASDAPTLTWYEVLQEIS